MAEEQVEDRPDEREVLDGFGSTAAGEDLFDAVVGLIGMIQTLHRAPEPDLPNAPEVRQLEGWMFGQHAECDQRACQRTPQKTPRA
ncbi:MAG: hypothetical protein ACXVHB_30175 [Solirubrobacteraceae bacterium]